MPASVPQRASDGPPGSQATRFAMWLLLAIVYFAIVIGIGQFIAAGAREF